MRMAEIYLIAAEANAMLGNTTKAADYINVLRKRACRNAADYESSMKLTSASEQDVLDEYARELVGEFQRWSVLNGHLSRPAVTNRFKQPTRKQAGHLMLSVWSCFGWGLHMPCLLPAKR
jgi:creatinine amidohydrolase/Fe(II)-dependent formamide hydrolase-like protein